MNCIHQTVGQQRNGGMSLKLCRKKAQLSPDDKMEVTAFLRVNAKQ
jgi:hypothetical protein